MHTFCSILIAALLFTACQSPTNQPSTPEPASVMSDVSTAPAESFLQHVVAFKFKEGTPAEAVQQHMDDFAGLQDKIPELRSYEAGKTFKVAYESTADYDVMHYTTFANEADMEVYFNHPDHQKFIADNKDSWADVFVSNSRVE
ncbi:MAG: Dabb family protein [Tunicatimonas sp.]